MSNDEEFPCEQRGVGYYEHDYRLFDDHDGVCIYHCDRCGAELEETNETEGGGER